MHLHALVLLNERLRTRGAGSSWAVVPHACLHTCVTARPAYLQVLRD